MNSNFELKKKVTIRPVEDGDINAIIAICNKTLRQYIESSGGDVNTLTEEFLRSTLDETKVLVAKINEKVIGYIQYQIKDEDLVINGAALAPKFQRKGIGTKLFAAAVKSAHEKKCRRVIISVQPGNTEIYKLYLRLGFKEGENPSGWNQQLHADMQKALEILNIREHNF